MDFAATMVSRHRQFMINLRSTIWGQALQPQELARVEAQISERAVPAGGYVCRKGEPVNHWIGIIDGLVELGTVSLSGKEATLTGVPSSGGCFGEGSLLKEEPRRYAIFVRLLDSSVAFNRFLLNQLNERLAQFIAMLEYERLLDPGARVARCLAWLFNPFLYPGVGQKLQVSQEEIGYRSGISRQRVSQALQALEKLGLLRVEYGGVTILDLEGLRNHGT
jgi:CRP/FNR family cyclic AMP-dependent transcriptional regulator